MFCRTHIIIMFYRGEKMDTKNKNTIDMVNGPLLKNIILFAIPLMCTNFLQMLFQAADTIVVGKFAGEISLAAVGATGAVIFGFTAIFNGLSVGTNVIVARLLGAKDEKQVSKTVHTSITLGIISGIFVAIAGFFLARPLLSLMSTPDDIIHLSTLYVQLYLSGSLFLLVYNFGAAILRSKGDTKRPLYFLMLSGIINVVLNTIFVVCFHWDVAGVAISTVISQFISAVLIVYTLIKEEDCTHLDLKKLTINWSIAGEIIRIGVPAGLQGFVFSISNLVVQSNINSFDNSFIVAGNSAGQNIENFVYIGMMAFTQATVTFTSQNIGARRLEAIKKIFNSTMLLTIISSLTISIFVWFFGEFFLSFYTNDALVVEVGMKRLTYIVLPLVCNGILDVILCSLRGMGYSSLPTCFMIIGICGVRLLWLAYAFPLNPTLEMIYYCFPLSWIITSIIQYIIWIPCHKKVLQCN